MNTCSKKEADGKIERERERDDNICGVMKAHCVVLDCMEATNQISEGRRVLVSFARVLPAIVVMNRPSL